MQLKEIRKKLGISQSQAARGLNITQATYNRYENGQRQIPNALLLAMADYFGVSADEILGREIKQDQPPDDEFVTPQIRIVSGWMERMPKEDQDRVVQMMQLMFTNHPELLKREDGNDDQNPGS